MTRCQQTERMRITANQIKEVDFFGKFVSYFKLLSVQTDSKYELLNPIKNTCLVAFISCLHKWKKGPNTVKTTGTSGVWPTIVVADQTQTKKQKDHTKHVSPSPLLLTSSPFLLLLFGVEPAGFVCWKEYCCKSVRNCRDKKSIKFAVVRIWITLNLKEKRNKEKLDRIFEKFNRSNSYR